MAIKGRSEQQKAALAEIVSSETLFDIEEYIRPQFPPKRASGELLTEQGDLPSLTLNARRRIVQDGHGRWREVKPQLYFSNLQPVSSTPGTAFLKLNKKTSQTNGGIRTIDSRLAHRRDSVDESTSRPSGNYNNLSMALRSNVFPGLGNNQWHSTTGKVFTEQHVIPSSQRDKFFGIQTDEFGQWSAANVHHERMKKKWDSYLDSLPKQADWKPQAPKEITPKAAEKSPPQAKVKKSNPKPKQQKREQKPSSTKNTVMPEEIPAPSLPPSIDIPADDDDDDNFWDFYDKPFNKPT